MDPSQFSVLNKYHEKKLYKMHQDVEGSGFVYNIIFELISNVQCRFSIFLPIFNEKKIFFIKNELLHIMHIHTPFNFSQPLDGENKLHIKLVFNFAAFFQKNQNFHSFSSIPKPAAY